MKCKYKVKLVPGTLKKGKGKNFIINIQHVNKS